MSDELLIERTDSNVVVLTLNRPEARNVVSDDPLLTMLTDECRRLADDDTVRAVILTGNGSAFSAGGNIEAMRDKSGFMGGNAAEVANGYRRGIQRLIMALYSLPMPTIAAVNGPAIGAGLDLALACDLRLAAGNARFAATFVNIGLAPADGGAWLLPRAVGPQKAAEMALSGRILDAQESLAAGLVLSLHEPDELMGEAHALANRIAAHPHVAVRYTKRLLRGSSSEGFDEHLAEVAHLQAILQGLDEHTEAVEALIEQMNARRSRSK
jgi:enoyl-CoA hydratase/carnithine racemase